MLPSGSFVALLVFATISSITPGPNNLMLMASGTNFGMARTVPHALGVTIGFCAMTMVIGTGLVRLFEMFPVAYLALKVGCVCFLLYLAWKIAIAAPISSTSAAGLATAKPFSFTQAALFQWVNPKGWTMALVAVTAYVPRSEPRLGLLVVVLVFGAVNLPCTVLWTLMGVKLRNLLNNSKALRAFNISMALLLVASLYWVVVGEGASLS